MKLKLSKELRKDLKKFKIDNQKLLVKFPLFDYVPKMIYGCSILSMDMVEKCKLLSNVDYHIVKKERYLYNLSKE